MKSLQKIIFISILAVFVIFMAFSIAGIQKNAGFKTIGTIAESSSHNSGTKNKIKTSPSANDAKKDNNTAKNTSPNSTAPAKQKNIPASSPKDIGKSNFPAKTIFIGDSITEGLSSYGLVDDEKVFASKGLTLKKAKDEIPDAAKANPERIFILLGTNDLLYGMKSSEYIKSYKELINLIRKSLPKADIYIESILPVTEEVQNKKPLLLNSRIDEFNNALIQMSKEEGVNYVKAAALFKNAKGCMDIKYSSDGIHIKFEAYKILLNYLKSNAK